MFTIQTASSSITHNVTWKDASSMIDALEANGPTGNQYFFEIREQSGPFTSVLVKYIFRKNNWLPFV